MSYILKLQRGRTYDKTMTRKAGGVAVDLTGKTLVFHLRKGISNTDYLTLSTDDLTANVNGSSLQYISQSGGTFRLILTDEETALMRFGRGFYSFSLEYGGAKFDEAGGRVTVALP